MGDIGGERWDQNGAMAHLFVDVSPFPDKSIGT